MIKAGMKIKGLELAEVNEQNEVTCFETGF